MAVSDNPAYTIDLPQPSNEHQMHQNLGALTKFANKLGLAGQRIVRLDVSKTTTAIVPEMSVTAHCEPQQGSN